MKFLLLLSLIFLNGALGSPVGGGPNLLNRFFYFHPGNVQENKFKKRFNAIKCPSGYSLVDPSKALTGPKKVYNLNDKVVGDKAGDKMIECGLKCDSLPGCVGFDYQPWAADSWEVGKTCKTYDSKTIQLTTQKVVTNCSKIQSKKSTKRVCTSKYKVCDTKGCSKSCLKDDFQ